MPVLKEIIGEYSSARRRKIVRNDSRAVLERTSGMLPTLQKKSAYSDCWLKQIGIKGGKQKLQEG